MAPDSNTAKLSSERSVMAGMRPFGLSATNAGSFDSLFEMSTKCGSYAAPVSSSMIGTLTPLGVGVA